MTESNFKGFKTTLDQKSVYAEREKREFSPTFTISVKTGEYRPKSLLDELVFSSDFRVTETVFPTKEEKKEGVVSRIKVFGDNGNVIGIVTYKSCPKGEEGEGGERYDEVFIEERSGCRLLAEVAELNWKRLNEELKGEEG